MESWMWKQVSKVHIEFILFTWLTDTIGLWRARSKDQSERYYCIWDYQIQWIHWYVTCTVMTAQSYYSVCLVVLNFKNYFPQKGHLRSSINLNLLLAWDSDQISFNLNAYMNTLKTFPWKSRGLEISINIWLTFYHFLANNKLPQVR